MFDYERVYRTHSYTWTLPNLWLLGKYPILWGFVGIFSEIIWNFARLCHPEKWHIATMNGDIVRGNCRKNGGRVIGVLPNPPWMIPTVCWKSRQEKPPLSSLFLFVFSKNHSLFPCIDFHLTILIICYSHHSYSNYKPILLRKLGHHLF